MNRLQQIDARIAELQKQRDDVQGTQTEIYTRIVGYYRSLKNWNRGKREEYRHRITFRSIGEEPTATKRSLSLGLPLTGPAAAVAAETRATVPPSAREAEEKAAAGATESEHNGGGARTVVSRKQTSYLYFYRATCPNCPPVKALLQQQDIGGVAVDVDTPEGVEEAIKYQVLSTPTVILLDEAGSVRAKLGNLRQLQEELHAPAGIG